MPKNRNTGSLQTGAVAKRVISDAFYVYCKHGKGQQITLFVPERMSCDPQTLSFFALAFEFLLDRALNPDSETKPDEWAGWGNAEKGRFGVTASALGNLFHFLTMTVGCRARNGGNHDGHIQCTGTAGAKHRRAE